MLFIDAIVPANGESIWSIFKGFHIEAFDQFIATSPDGLLTGPPPGTDARARAHPLATFLQPSKLTQQAYAPTTKIYAWCDTQKGTPFEMFHNRLEADPAWTTRTMACGHDFMNEAPELGLEVILDAAVS